MKVVIDASVAVKWLVDEEGSADALRLLESNQLAAPDLLMSECANIFWKKVRRRELSREEAAVAARLMQGVDIELLPTRHLLEAATSLAIELDHPAYDCVYLALALENDWPFVTADGTFCRKLQQSGDVRFQGRVLSLSEAALSVTSPIFTSDASDEGF
ncbi:MAG: type II toxin-antitoxin system VapC family toxin [Nitrococcus sp.]|nr:type II toxin-antitoxin system VapC family toxin [Nitrococcus sp.]